MMEAVSRFHFIAGLPRSGSTLLGGILRQNPAAHAAMSSPVASMCGALQLKMSDASEYAMMFDDALRATMLRGVFNAYYSALPPGSLVFDTNRAWHKHAALLGALYPRSKVICCVRDISWIIDSVERMLVKNPLRLSRMFGFATGESIYDRVEQMMDPKKGFIGRCLTTFREAWFGDNAGRLIIVPYDHLAREPRQTLARLYEALGEAPFAHDFDNVVYDEPGYDEKLGMPGMHQVHQKVEYRERKTCIPPDLFAKYAELNFWKRPELNLRGVTII